MNHAIKVSYEIAEDRIIEIEFTRKLNNQKETAFIEALQLDNQERFTLHLDTVSYTHLTLPTICSV